MTRNDYTNKIIEQMDEVRKSFAQDKGPFALPKDFPSPTQIKLLFLINDNKQMSVAEIAEKMNISSSAATQFIDALVAEDYLERIADTQDRRKMIISLSEKAKNKMQVIKKYRKEKFLELTKLLSIDELKTLASIQEKMIKVLTKRIK